MAFGNVWDVARGSRQGPQRRGVESRVSVGLVASAVLLRGFQCPCCLPSAFRKSRHVKDGSTDLAGQLELLLQAASLDAFSVIRA